ncbi:carbon-nitrogen hydrolase family protein [Inquilinus limosus]|uniref:Carbon-nitrogen hydrolase family protein n=1 Tax=Inquilinus limosus TaxID=171674 RepID=A0A211ZV61_9PROT|nr:carbon-nitrogen hydrolase family protein [Inquilinus limosus]OWJ69099.1 carbon-nitrogen hydrolase family protein [Inquilinus limosus]
MTGTRTCAFVEWLDGLEPYGAQWNALRRQIEALRPHILVTNEMPFGPWLAAVDRFDTEAARRSVSLHERAIDALAAIGVPIVISSRPVWTGDRLANEAFALADGRITPLHRKQYFPEETGWYEATWFRGDSDGFAVHDVAGLKVGVLLCTELMFNERARRYGRAGAELIVVPRATGLANANWLTAGAMAAIVSGSYVVSSNRVGGGADGPTFGGRGFAFAPDGNLLAETSAAEPVKIVVLDVAAARRQKAEYPCYVADAD